LAWCTTCRQTPSRPPAPQRTALGGVSEDDRAKSLAARIQKVGMVEVRDANRPLQTGEAVYKAQCVACHAAGVANAPKLGDAGAWGARIKTGLDALVTSALKGKGAMGPQGGGDFDDVEIARAVGVHEQFGRCQVCRAPAPRGCHRNGCRA
jgi:cytochrome c5